MCNRCIPTTQAGSGTRQTSQATGRGLPARLGLGLGLDSPGGRLSQCSPGMIRDSFHGSSRRLELASIRKNSKRFPCTSIIVVRVDTSIQRQKRELS